MDVLGLLRSKNRCLSKFLDASKTFLSEAQSLGALPDLSQFELKRESILKAIFLFDRKLSEAVTCLSAEEKTPALIESVRNALDEKDALLHQIMTTDDRVLRLVEEEKVRITKEITSSQKSRNTIQKFKSAWVAEAGEEIDQNL
jgi:hypothetical protein